VESAASRRFRLNTFSRGLPRANPIEVPSDPLHAAALLRQMSPRLRLEIDLFYSPEDIVHRVHAFGPLLSRADYLTVFNHHIRGWNGGGLVPRMSLDESVVRVVAESGYLSTMQAVFFYQLNEPARELCRELIEPFVPVECIND